MSPDVNPAMLTSLVTANSIYSRVSSLSRPGGRTRTKEAAQ